MTKQVIDQAYQQTSSKLKSVYRKRKIASWLRSIVWLLMGVWLIGTLAVFAKDYLPSQFNWLPVAIDGLQNDAGNPYSQLIYIAPLIVGISLSSYIFAHAFSRFKTLEMETMAKMIELLFPGSEYSQITRPPTEIALKSRLFPSINKGTPLYSFGQMRSSIDGVTLNIADLGIAENNIRSRLLKILMSIPLLNILVILYEYVYKNIVGSRAVDTTQLSFRGMYAWANFNKDLASSTVVVSNSLLNKADRAASFNYKDEEKVSLEDPDFMKHFTVYSPDQVESRYVLNPLIMEKLKQLKEKFDRDIMISFVDNQVFLAVHNPDGLFSFAPGKLDSVKVIEEIATEIQAAQSIVAELRLSKHKTKLS